jgi:hypothetical protein
MNSMKIAPFIDGRGFVKKRRSLVNGPARGAGLHFPQTSVPRLLEKWLLEKSPIAACNCSAAVAIWWKA